MSLADFTSFLDDKALHPAIHAMKCACLASWIFSGLVSAASGAYAQNSITGLNAVGIGNGTTLITVDLVQPLSNLPPEFATATPPRIVLDFPDTANGLGRSVQRFTEGSSRSANVVQVAGRTRLVINLDHMLAYNTTIDGSSLLIALQGNAADADEAGNALSLSEPKQDMQSHTPPAAGPEERRPAETLVQAGSLTTPLAQLIRTPEVELLRKLLGEADALLKAGRPADAYKLLEPKEPEYSGEIAFDYLLGIAALDSGKPDRATIAFERVLAVNPNFAGARLDMARAYFAMGSDDLAKNEFEIVLTQDPPDATAAVIRKHLEVIAERQQAKIQQITAYLETSIGHDSNITAASSDNIAGVAGILGRTQAELIALQYRPTGSSLHFSGTYTGVSGGVDFNRLVSEENGISVFAGADVKQRIYNNLEEMNNLTLDLRGGVGIVNGEDRFRLSGTFGIFRQSGFPQTPPSNGFRDTAGLSAEWRRSFGNRDQMGWSLGYSWPRYLAEPSRAQDTNQLSLNASWLHIFEGGMTPLIFANVSHSVDKALRPVNVETGANMGRTGTGMLAHFQFTPWSNTDLFLSGGVTRRRDDSPGARSPGLPDFFARDETRSVNIGFTARPWKKWTIKGTVAQTSNRSNLSLYEYRRNDSSVSLRWDF